MDNAMRWRLDHGAPETDYVSSVERVFHLHYEVKSPRGNLWVRAAGPFKNATDARAHRDALEGVVSHRITEVITTTRVVEDVR